MNHDNRALKCWDCRYHMKHFAKSDAQIIQIYGHCINEELNKGKKYNKYRLHSNCGHWEPIEIQKEERRMKIKEVLRRMQKDLERIAFILNDDSD